MEPAPFDISLHRAALIVLGAAAVVIALFQRRRVSSVLVLSALASRSARSVASLSPSLPWLWMVSYSGARMSEPTARLGVVLLLFMIGLELSFEIGYRYPYQLK